MTSFAEQYLDAVQAGLTRLERQLPSIAAAATRAAERACAGGRVWALSDEEGFVSELQHRASGLMMVRGIPGGETFELDDGVSPGDTVVAATQDNATDRQGALLDGLAERGVAVTLIGSADSPLRPRAAAFIDTGLPAGSGPVLPYGDATICPLASALNISAGWLWCIEMANACAALGRAPVFLMSGGLATGMDRNAQHEGKAFHDPGEYTIVPSPAGQKGRELLSEWLRCLVGIRATELDKIAEIGALAAATRAAGHAVWCASIGHNLHAQRGLAGDPGFFRLIFPERNEKADLEAGDFFIFNGYYTFPDDELPAARATVERSAWILGGREIEAIYPHPGEIHVNAYWRYGDASINLAGYDVRVVPPSGVITTAMLWLLHAAAADHTPPERRGAPMEPIPHIDVAEEARIEALLAAPGNHSWPAIDSESMDGWVPDLGLTGYANYSIYRPPAVAAAGITTTVRHRFRVPPRNPKLPGTYYLGVLIYDQAGEEFPLELSLGSEEVGRIEPRRHDNRRHLIVIGRPIVFDDRVKWVQFSSSGRGACRIERFVLLAEAPESSSFAPAIERLHVEVDASGDTAAATVHCLTFPPSTVTASVRDQSGATVAESAPDGPSTLHAIPLADLPIDRTWTARLTATEPDGETTESVHEFSTRRPKPRAASDETPVEADVELCATGAAASLAGLPLTFGVPVQRGALFSAGDARLVWGDGPADASAAQTRIHSRWPDGSARWVLVDAAVPPSLQPGGRADCRVLLSAAEESSLATGLSVDHRDGAVVVAGRMLRVSVQPRAEDWILLEPAAGGSPIAGGLLNRALRVELADGTPLDAAAGEASVEHAGPLRTTVRCDALHRDAAGHARLRSELRIHVYAEQSFVKVDHRLVVLCADPSADPVFEPGVDEERALLGVRSCVLAVPFAAAAVELDDERFELPGDRPWSLRHEHDLAHDVVTAAGRQCREGRTPGHVRIHSAAGPVLAAGIRTFWQTCPKGIAVTDDTVRLEILPELSGEELPGDDEAWQRIYRWLQDGRYLLREGLALTTELLLALPGDGADRGATAPLFDWLESPVAVRPRLAYTNATGALPRLASKENSPQPRYERFAADALRLFHEDRERWRAYGHLNFGDWYGEGDWSWGNNEYDTPYCAYWEFLRGGEPGWATWGAQSARHLADVDTVNAFHDARHVGLQPMHMPAHLGGYLPAYFRSKVPGTRGNPSHMWAEGPLLHFLLTGDQAVRDSLLRSAGWLLQPERLDHYEFSAVREAGWHLIHLTMLASATGDRRAANGAAVVVRRILEKQDASGGWTRMLTSGHCWCGYPHCRGNIAFMVTVLLSALKRYYDLTGEAPVSDAILAGGRWLVRETFDEETGMFIGGSCKTMQRLSKGEVFGTQIIIEGVADAFAVSGDREIGRCLQRALPAIGVMPDVEGHRDLGKQLSSQMRYVPTVLAALEESHPADSK